MVIRASVAVPGGGMPSRSGCDTMPTMRTALLCLLGALLALTLTASGAEGKKRTRGVLVVSNNWEGTADLINPRKFNRLERINVIPDKAERIAEISADPAKTFYYNSIRQLVGEGHDQYVDDGFISPDGRVVYFSRPSF